MSKAKYTRKLYGEFRKLCLLLDSLDQLDRIKGRLEMRKFVDKHGKEICDSMFEELKKEKP